MNSCHRFIRWPARNWFKPGFFKNRTVYAYLTESVKSLSTGPALLNKGEWKPNFAGGKVLKSDYPDVDIPLITYPQYALTQMEKFGRDIFMINGETGVEYSYEKTLGEICRVSSSLIRRGVRPGDRVAFFSFNRPEYVIAWFAATAVGAIATDANPSFTANELLDQLKFTKADYLFTHQVNAEKAKEAAANVPTIKKIFVFGEADRCEPYSELAKDPGDLFKGPYETDPANVLHLPCSSGTTGLPKAVMRSHTNLVATTYVTNNDEIRLFQSTAVGMLLLPLYHMYANFLTGAALLVGAKLVLQERFSPEATLQILEKYKVTTFHLVPPLVMFLAQHPLVSKYDLSNLKQVFSGAAPVSQEVLGYVKEKLNLNFVGQGYGATEMCPISIIPKGTSNFQCTGRIVCNTQVKVVSTETGEELDVGLQGEIVSKGPQIMSGYENNPEATSSTIVDGWLKTGDIGYIDDEGYVHIVDRLKDFIKVKGHQVAPAELEALLLMNPVVEDVAVIGVQDDRAGEVPRAYVVLKEKNFDVKQLQQFVAERVSPEKQLAGGIVVLEQIPKSASGKILKKDLRKILS